MTASNAKGGEAFSGKKGHLKDFDRDFPGGGGGGAFSGGGGRPGPPNPQSPAGTGKRAQKRAAAAAAANAAGGPLKFAKQHQLALANLGGQPGGGASAGSDANGQWWNKQREDGRYMYNEARTKICYKFNREPNGCVTDPTAPCACQPKRAHQCEWCRGNHRAINCPAHPDWMPPLPKGKGKGRAGK